MPKKIVLFYSRDTAGKNIVEALKKQRTKAKIIEIQQEILYLEDMSGDPDVCIVASRHKSDSKIPVLTTHSPGNFNTCDFGGKNRELSIAPALYLGKALTLLREEKRKKDLGYEVGYEVTHHGPTSLHFPIMFVEVGSDEEKWRDKDACDAVAEVIKGLTETEPEKTPVAIAFGGGHYCRKFSQIERYAIGHICPKYSLEKVDHDMIEQMIEKTTPKPETAIIEKKGMGKEKQRILGLLEETMLEVVKV